MNTVRIYPFQEEIKLVVFEVFGEGEINFWASDYEKIKETTNILEVSVKALQMCIDSGMTIQEAREVLKTMLIESKELNDVQKN